MSQLLWKIKASKGYHKALLIVCIVSAIIGVISVIMGLWWGVLQIIISGGIGISAYLRMKEAERIQESGERYSKTIDEIGKSLREQGSPEEFVEYVEKHGKVHTGVFGTHVTFDKKAEDKNENMAD